MRVHMGLDLGSDFKQKVFNPLNPMGLMTFKDLSSRCGMGAKMGLHDEKIRDQELHQRRGFIDRCGKLLKRVKKPWEHARKGVVKLDPETGRNKKYKTLGIIDYEDTFGGLGPNPINGSNTIRKSPIAALEEEHYQDFITFRDDEDVLEPFGNKSEREAMVPFKERIGMGEFAVTKRMREEAAKMPKGESKLHTPIVSKLGPNKAVMFYGEGEDGSKGLSLQEALDKRSLSLGGPNGTGNSNSESITTKFNPQSSPAKTHSRSNSVPKFSHPDTDSNMDLVNFIASQNTNFNEADNPEEEFEMNLLQPSQLANLQGRNPEMSRELERFKEVRAKEDSDIDRFHFERSRNDKFYGFTPDCRSS